MNLLHNPIAKKFFNIPFVWDALESFVGANQWKKILYPSVFNKKGKILDFGCSIGTSTASFIDFDYWGVDVDPQVIKEAQKRFGAHSNVHFVATDILKEPFSESDFDHVLLACTAHHLDDKSLRGVIDTLLSKLKKGGELHIFDPLSQPEKDNFITKLFIRADQGRYIRTIEENKKIFSAYSVAEKKIFPSPNNFIKLEDMLYVRLIKNHD